MTGKVIARVVLIAAVTLPGCSMMVPPRAPPAAGAAAVQPAATNDLLASAVYWQLNADPIYFFRHVDVRVDGGIAYLSGYVWSTDALYQARRLARSVPGVNGVVTSQLELERNGRSNGASR